MKSEINHQSQIKALQLLFNPGEYSFFTNNVKSSAPIVPVESSIGKSFEYMSINPLLPNTNRCSKNVKEYRNFLIEYDVGFYSFDEQIEHANLIGLPFSLAIESGNKSIHFFVCLKMDIGSERYNEIASSLVEACKSDKAVKDPARLARFPEGLRIEKNRIQTVRQIKERVDFDVLSEWYNKININTPNAIRLDSSSSNANNYNGFKGVLNSSTISFFTVGTKSNWNNTLFSSACNAFGAGWSIEKVARAVGKINWRLEPGDISTIKSAFKTIHNQKISLDEINEVIKKLNIEGIKFVRGTTKT